jgi:hypothetical protein
MSSEDEVVPRERVVFKYEDDDGDEMIGPVWVDILGGEGEVVSSEDLNWMTLTKARELAQERGCELVEDTGDDEDADDSQQPWVTGRVGRPWPRGRDATVATTVATSHGFRVAMRPKGSRGERI